MKGAFKIRLLVFVLLWVQPLVECQPTKCPLANNIVKYGPNGEIVGCVRCSNCPIGQGLSYACGSKVPNDSKIECEFCEPKKTYSDEHGVGHCKQCQDCGLRNVIQECSIYKNRECGKICPKGYVFHDNIEDCLKLESEPSTPLSTNYSKDTSHRETTGRQLIKTVLVDEVTTTDSSHSNRITESSSQPQFPSTGVDNTPTKGTSLHENVDTANVSPTKDSTVAICVLVAVIVLVILVLVIIVIICKTRQDHTPNRPEELTDSPKETTPLNEIIVCEDSSEASDSSSTTQEDLPDPAPQDKTKELLNQPLVDIPRDNKIHNSINEMSSCPSDAQAEDGVNLENIPAAVPVSHMEQLCKENGNMYNYVKKKLDPLETFVLKTWRSVGRELKLDADTLNLIGADIIKSPTECLLEKLKTLPKEPTMREFVQALKRCERYDIARYICNWPWKVENN